MIYVLYHVNLVTVNERIKGVREHRALTSKALAQKARVSASEVSLVERQMRRPNTETLQRIAAALEVSSSYLLSEVNADLPIGEALSRESFQIFLRDTKLDPEDVRPLREIADTPSAPQSVNGWRHLLTNLKLYQTLSNGRP